MRPPSHRAFFNFASRFANTWTGSATLLALALFALVAPLIFKGLKRFKGDDA
ncbi:hypothetical protein M2282_000065 [Variovorax boronicumulans]|uniref:hypothetical protein n=1 Tax=Variovorax boronicumulans TaxID=436515 RepID=UPI002472F323|nr:hypothetical protein [Variovorax boronicumulans]MDH6164937.1 hypothetical protein [Variovorax boronicumulans]